MHPKAHSLEPRQGVREQVSAIAVADEIERHLDSKAILTQMFALPRCNERDLVGVFVAEPSNPLIPDPRKEKSESAEVAVSGPYHPGIGTDRFDLVMKLSKPAAIIANAVAERFVGSATSECSGRIVPLGEKHLRQLSACVTLVFCVVIDSEVSFTSTSWRRDEISHPTGQRPS